MSWHRFVPGLTLDGEDWCGFRTGIAMSPEGGATVTFCGQNIEYPDHLPPAVDLLRQDATVWTGGDGGQVYAWKVTRTGLLVEIDPYEASR